jgi:hypothetical protein
MRSALVWIASVALFVLSAKAHGRELRLERELAGHWSVTFGAPNHPWVEALWRAERLRFWGFTLTLVALLVAADALRALPWLREADGARRWGRLALAALLWAPSISFIVSGVWALGRVLSMARSGAGDAGPAAASAAWMAAATWGSFAWWASVLALAIAVAFSGLRVAGGAAPVPVSGPSRT